MARSIHIRRQDMHDFLSMNGHKPIVMTDGTKELVYGKIVAAGVCLRVYTSVVGEQTRDNGEDAIRCVLVTKAPAAPTAGSVGKGSVVRIIGVDKRVHRVEGWKKNLQDRLDNWEQQLGPACPRCGCPTVQRRSRRGPFWGCSSYPACYSVTPISSPSVAAPSVVAPPLSPLPLVVRWRWRWRRSPTLINLSDWWG